jgi:asparagine synthase (glutamine-hydrolysing)
MSGIVGIINLDGQPVDRQLVRQMTNFMTYRGPDAQEVWVNGPVGLGHALLQTTEDTLPECQPHSLDGQVWISADARIDGRADLIRKLSGHVGNDPENPTDVELILLAYHVWGEDCLLHLIGDFAFAIWDGHRRRLFCVRDHLGVKPFYYVDPGRTLIFSNTLNCIQQHPDVSHRLNDLAIADFLLFDSNQDPTTTSFADIRRLPAAHFLTWEAGGPVKVQRYWRLPQESVARYRRQRDYVDRFQELLYQAVGDRLRTSRVGVFLSGGLDSPMVTAIAQELLAAQATRFDLNCFTVVFDWLIPHEERFYAGAVARHLQVPIKFLPLDDYALYGRQAELRWPESCPGPRDAASSDFINLAAGLSRVILTGEGGDEILYPSKSHIYGLARSLRLAPLVTGMGRSIFLYGHIPQVGFKATLRRWRHRNSQNCLDTGFPKWLQPDFAARLELRNRWDQLSQGFRPEHPVRPEACAFLGNPLLQEVFERQYDPESTGRPVEFRHPLLDVRLLSFALTLPPLPWCVDKIMLRELAKGRLPEAVRRRPKTPLADYPELAQVRRPDSRWLDDFDPCDGLAAYVRRAAVPPVTTETDPWRLRINLRPVSLNLWLENLSAGYPDPVEDHEETD